MKKFMENSIKRVMGNKKNADKKKLKGFTLVEIIVVLVILAILAAAMIPALTGYIDKAKEKTAISEARNVVTAAQTIASEKYALDSKSAITLSDEEVLKLADLWSGSNAIGEAKIENYEITKGKIKKLVYTTTDGYNVTYDAGKFSITTPTQTSSSTTTPPTTTPPADNGEN